MQGVVLKSNDLVRVLIADDNFGIREAVKNAIGERFEIVGEAADGLELVALERVLEPSIGIIDISMPKQNGIQAVEAIKSRGSEMKIVFLTVHEDPDFVKAAFDCGAVGYVVKRQMASDLPKALDVAIAGGIFTSCSGDSKDRN